MSNEGKREKKIGAVHVLPVAITVALAWVYTWIVMSSSYQFPQPPLTPIEEPPAETPQEGLTNLAPYLNTLLFVGYVAVGGFVVYLITKRFPRVVKYFAAILFGLSAFSILVLYGFMVTAILGAEITDYLILPAILLAAGLTRMLWAKTGLLRVLSASVVGTGVGVYLGTSIPLWTSLVFVVAISAYDIIAVYKGPLGKLAELDLNTMRGLVVDFMDVFVGLGDIVFYSMLISMSRWHFDVLAGAAATVGILIGFGVTLIALRRGGPAPGLPASLIIGLALALLTRAA